MGTAHFGQVEVIKIKTWKKLSVILCGKKTQNVFYSMSTVLGKMKSLKSYLIIITHKMECVFIWSWTLRRKLSDIFHNVCSHKMPMNVQCIVQMNKQGPRDGLPRSRSHGWQGMESAYTSVYCNGILCQRKMAKEASYGTSLPGFRVGLWKLLAEWS